MLAHVITHWPKVWKTLNAARPRKPKLEAMGFRYISEEHNV